MRSFALIHAVAFAGVVGLAGCNATKTSFDLPIGHPADPHSRSAAPVTVTRALDDSNEPRVQPAVYEDRKTPVPENGDHSHHHMHKH